MAWGRASDSRLQEPRFKSCAAVLKPWACFFTLHWSSSLCCINEYLAVDSGGYVCEQPSRIKCSIWLDASQRSRDGVWVNRSVREVKCKTLWMVLRTGYIRPLPFISIMWTFQRMHKLSNRDNVSRPRQAHSWLTISAFLRLETNKWQVILVIFPCLPTCPGVLHNILYVYAPNKITKIWFL